jgi:hypothetical protein
MPDTKITALTAISTVDPAVDVLPIVDVSDTTMAASGTTKKVTLNQLLATSPTATLASATISGDLTVDTNTLFVNSTNNRVGIGNASPAAALDIVGGKDSTNTIIGAPLSTVGGGSFANYSELLFKNTSGSNSDASIRSYGNVWNSAGSQLAFFTSNNSAVTERYRIDNTGVATWSNVGGVAGTAMTLNSTGLGVGVTPSAYGTGVRGVDVGAWTSVAQIGAASFLGFNSYASTTGQFNYKNSGAIALGYFQTTSGHLWLNAPSNAGAAGANATFTTVMTLDTNGNLILLPSNTPPTLATNGQLTVNATSNTNLRFSYRGSDGVTRVANLTLA